MKRFTVMAKRLSGIVDKPWSFFAIFLFVAIFFWGFVLAGRKAPKLVCHCLLTVLFRVLPFLEK